MKKILSTEIAIAALAMGAAQAQNNASLSFINFGNALVSLADGTPVSTLGSGAEAGYVAMFWWSATSDPATFKPLAIDGFADYLWGDDQYAGVLYSEGGPLTVSIPVGTTASYTAITVFRIDSLVGADSSDWDDFFSLYNGNEGAMMKLWDDATKSASGTSQVSDIVGDENLWFGTIVHNPIDGSLVNYLPWDFDPAWDSGTIKLGKSPITNTLPVPEPSTWLLLAAGAAFSVVMRRRKK